MPEKINLLEVNWKDYFKSISDVCQWSLKAYQSGKLMITEFSSFTNILKNDVAWQKKYSAILYTDIPHDIDRLLEFVEEANSLSKNCVYFFSHPDHTKGKNKQTPIPCIIQQDKKKLYQIRYYEKKKRSQARREQRATKRIKREYYNISKYQRTIS
jgi:hypothetical protein